MKITIGNVTLADSPDPIPMVNFRVNGSRSIQEAQFFRATAASYYDRGNRKTEVTFETWRSFTDQKTAEQFVLEHETQLPGKGLVTFSANNQGETSGTSRYLINAVIENVSSEVKGCTTKHSYRIRGGIMTTKAS